MRSLLCLLLVGCLEPPAPIACYAADGCPPAQACQAGVCVARPDAGAPDAGVDARALDARAPDAVVDARVVDARSPDAAPDAQIPDAAPDATLDARIPDTALDAGPDTQLPDAAPPDAAGPLDPDATPVGGVVLDYQAGPVVPLHQGAGELQVAAAWAGSAWIIAWSDEDHAQRTVRVMCVPPHPQNQPAIIDLDTGDLLGQTTSRPSIAVGPDGFRVARPVAFEGENRIQIAHFALPVAGRCAAPLSDLPVLPEQSPGALSLVQAGDRRVALWQTRDTPDLDPIARVAWLDEAIEVLELADPAFARRTGAWHPGLGRLGYAWHGFGGAGLAEDLYFNTLGPDGSSGFERLAASSPRSEKSPWTLADGEGFGLVAHSEADADPQRILEFHTLGADGQPTAPPTLLGHMIALISVGNGPPVFDGQGTLGVAWQGLGDGVQPSLDLSLRRVGEVAFHRLRLAAQRPTSVALAGGPDGFAVVVAEGRSLALIEVE